MLQTDIEKQAFMAAGKALASGALKVLDRGSRSLGRIVGKAGKGVAEKVSKGSTKGRFNLTHAKNQRIAAGGAALGTVGMGAALKGFGGKEKKAELIFNKTVLK